MSKKELLDKLELLKTQQKQAKEVFIKCEGAIEILEDLVKNYDKKKKDE